MNKIYIFLYKNLDFRESMFIFAVYYLMICFVYGVFFFYGHPTMSKQDYSVVQCLGVFLKHYSVVIP